MGLRLASITGLVAPIPLDQAGEHLDDADQQAAAVSVIRRGDEAAGEEQIEDRGAFGGAAPSAILPDTVATLRRPASRRLGLRPPRLS